MKRKFWSSAGVCECRISGGPFGIPYYCDTCAKCFYDYNKRPCGIYGVESEQTIEKEAIQESETSYKQDSF